jgi:hypothetical protein
MTSPVDPSQLQLDLDHIRRRRIGQFILVMLATIVGLALVNALFAQPLAVGTLFFAVSALSLALFLLHKRYIDVAGILAALVMFFCIAQAMWTGHGLRSSVLLVYPAALFFVMIMIGKRAFYIAFVAMLIYMTALMTANLQGWRQGPENMTEVRWLLDYTILLTCVAFVILAALVMFFCIAQAMWTGHDSANLRCLCHSSSDQRLAGPAGQSPSPDARSNALETGSRASGKP